MGLRRFLLQLESLFSGLIKKVGVLFTTRVIEEVKRMRLIGTIFFLLFFMNYASAEIYTCKDAKGNTIYTDSPSECANAEEVEVDELPELVPTKPIVVPRSSNSPVKQDTKNKYSELKITSPDNDSTIRNNQGDLTINFQSTPALQTRFGHKYVVNMDGKEIYTGTSTVTTLKNVDRGTHTISVKIVTADNRTVISATPVLFTLHRFSKRSQVDLTNSDSTLATEDARNSNPFTFPQNTKAPLPSTPRSN